MSYSPPPLPMAPLAYDMGPGRTRPGIVTAMGVMSIVVACISGLASLWGALMGLGFFMMSQITLPPPTAMPAPGGMTIPAPGGGGAGAGTVTIGGIEMRAEDSPDTLTEPQRRVIVTTLTRISGMDEKRTKHLDLLLTVSGQKVFPFAASPGLTMQKVRANITEKGTLPSVSGNGPDYFITGTGRLECYDDHAVFRPDGSTDVVSATANATSGDQTTPADDGSTGETPATAPAPAVGPGPAMRTQTTAVNIRNGRMSVTTTRRGPVMPPGMPFKVRPAAAATTMIESLASLALAIFLLVAGIVVLRESRSGRKLHAWYVALKIPLVIVAGIAGWYVWHDFAQSFNATMSSMPAGPGTRPPPMFTGAFQGIGIVFASMFAMAYPVALIFVLISRTVREYYGSIRE